MPPEIIALIEKPYLLIAVLLVGAFAGMIIERFLSKMRRQSWRERNRWRWEEQAQWGRHRQRAVARKGRPGGTEATRCC